MKYIIFIILLSHVGFAIAGGPWLQPVGGGYTHLSFTYLSYNQYNSTAGVVKLNRQVTDWNAQSYSEWSLTDRLGVVVDVPYKYAYTSANALNNTGLLLEAHDIHTFGNVEIGIKVPLFDSDSSFIVTGQVNFLAPTALVLSSYGLRTGFHAGGIIPSVHVGYLIDWFYAQCQLGILLRTDKYSIEYFLKSECGIHFKNRIFFAADLEVNQSFYNGKRNDGNSLQTALFLNDREFVSFGFKTLVKISKKIGVSYGVFSAIATNNVPNAIMHYVSFVYQWEPWKPHYKSVISDS